MALIEGLVRWNIRFYRNRSCSTYRRRKSKGIEQAPFGIVGLETAFPLLYTHLVKTGEWTLKQLVDFLTIKPAEVFGFPFGKLEVGVTADFVLIDLKKEQEIDKETFISKGKNTPFNGWIVKVGQQ